MRKSVRVYFFNLPIMELSEKIAKAIEARLQYLRINRQQFAEMMGVRPSNVTKWLKGDHNFELRTIVKIEQALKFKLFTIGNEKNKERFCFPYTMKINGKLVFESYKKQNDAN